jgi:Serine dehydrogenase proteinase
MSYRDRLLLYKDIEAIRERPLVCYITSIRPQASGQIAGDIIPGLIKQIHEISLEYEGVDLLVVSNGGDGITAARIISLLRERFKEVAVLLPYVAYSAATLLALGADEIVMHPFSNLGPVDPQLTAIRPGQGGGMERVNYGTEDLRNYFSFVRTEVGVSDQREMAHAFELLCKEVGAVPIGIAKRSAQLSLALGEKLLSLHMDDSSQAKAITETLSRSYHHHGYPLGRSDAKKIGLPVVQPPQKLEEKIWKVWENFEQEMECNSIFEPLEIVLKNPDAARLVAPVTQLQIPANLPPQVAQAAYNQILQQIGIITVPAVDYECFLVALESTRCKSEYRAKGKFSAVRQPDMNISVSTIPVSQGWTHQKTEHN